MRFRAHISVALRVQIDGVTAIFDAQSVRGIRPFGRVRRTHFGRGDSPWIEIMRPSERFQRQHKELFELALEIDAALAVPDFPRNARAVRRMMARFKGKLAVHSTMENDALYPRLLEHRDPETRALSQELFDELGGIYDMFAVHHTRWSSVEEIEADPARYVLHTREIFAMLKRRMERENRELYPLADREDISAVPPSRAPS